MEPTTLHDPSNVNANRVYRGVYSDRADKLTPAHLGLGIRAVGDYREAVHNAEHPENVAVAKLAINFWELELEAMLDMFGVPTRGVGLTLGQVRDLHAALGTCIALHDGAAGEPLPATLAPMDANVWVPPLQHTGKDVGAYTGDEALAMEASLRAFGHQPPLNAEVEAKLRKLADNGELDAL